MGGRGREKKRETEGRDREEGRRKGERGGKTEIEMRVRGSERER